MNKIVISSLLLLLIIGVGCVSTDSIMSVGDDLSQDSVPEAIEKEWQEIVIGSVITIEIPKHCITEGAAGSTYIICPTPEVETPVPEMVVSTDGITVNIRRWEDLESDIWDHAIASLRIRTPLSHEIQINIEE